jgi:hypothetical protein
MGCTSADLGRSSIQEALNWREIPIAQVTGTGQDDECYRLWMLKNSVWQG